MYQFVIAAVVLSALDARGLESTEQPSPQQDQTRTSTPRIQIARPTDGARPVICKNQLLPGSYMRERVCKSKAAWQGQPDIVPGRTDNPDNDPAQ